MQTLDQQYLETHPLGDEKADFTLTVKIPASAGVPLNRDGSTPQVTIRVTADTYMTALIMLGNLHDDYEDLVGTWVAQQLSRAQYRKAIKLADRGEKPAFVQAAADKIHKKFLTFETSITMSTTEEGGVEGKHVLGLTITAPSVSIGMKGFVSCTRPRSLQDAAIAFCPELEDEDGEYGSSNEVMVIG